MDIKVGSTFNTYDEFYTIFSKQCEQNFHVTHIQDSHKIKDESLAEKIKYNDIYLTCVHYGKHVLGVVRIMQLNRVLKREAINVNANLE